MIRKGEEIRDSAGALYATITRDLYPGDAVLASDFDVVNDKPLFAGERRLTAGQALPVAIVEFMKSRTARNG